MGDPVTQVLVALIVGAAGFLGFRRVQNQDNGWSSLVSRYAAQVAELEDRLTRTTQDLEARIAEKDRRIAYLESVLATRHTGELPEMERPE